MLPELTQNEFSTALDAVAIDLLAEVGVVEPPVDAVRVAAELGLVVAWDARQQGRGRIVRLRSFGRDESHGSILLRPDPRPERLQWAVAHEIGESCAYQVFERLAVDPHEAPPGSREMVSNQLAARLLLPREWFGDDAHRLAWDLPALKRRYATASHELVARRMLDFDPAIAITIFDHGRRTFRRGNLARRVPPLAPAEQIAWLAAHDRSRPAVKADSTCRAQAWPIHEPDWKREIVRTEWFANEWEADEPNFSYQVD